MIDALTDNALFGILISPALYIPAVILYRKTRTQLLNPLVISLIGLFAILRLLDIPLSHYMKGGEYLIALLPVTIILLALPLYRQLPLLIEHKFPILAGIAAGVSTSAVSVFALCRLLNVDTVFIRSLIPKSITTPLGIVVSQTLGGIVSVTVISIVITGLMGVVLYIPVFKIFRITHPVAQGVAFGTTSHAMGTSKAMELGEVTGAMSSLAIVLAGLLTVAAAPLFLLVFSFL